MLNQKALDYIFDVNTKIDAKLSRHFRDMERVYAVIARAAAKRRQWEEEESEQGPHVYLQPRCTPRLLPAPGSLNHEPRFHLIFDA